MRLCDRSDSENSQWLPTTFICHVCKRFLISFSSYPVEVPPANTTSSTLKYSAMNSPKRLAKLAPGTSCSSHNNFRNKSAGSAHLPNSTNISSSSTPATTPNDRLIKSYLRMILSLLRIDLWRHVQRPLMAACASISTRTQLAFRQSISRYWGFRPSLPVRRQLALPSQRRSE